MCFSLQLRHDTEYVSSRVSSEVKVIAYMVQINHATNRFAIEPVETLCCQLNRRTRR